MNWGENTLALTCLYVACSYIVLGNLGVVLLKSVFLRVSVFCPQFTECRTVVYQEWVFFHSLFSFKFVRNYIFKVIALFLHVVLVTFNQPLFKNKNYKLSTI